MIIIIPKGPLETKDFGSIPIADNALPVEAVVTKFNVLKKEILFFTKLNMDGL